MGKKKNTREVMNLVDAILIKKDAHSAPQIKKILKSQHNIEISESSIRKIIRELGWTFSWKRVISMMSDGIKAERLAQAKAWMESKEQFNDVIFTDETSFSLSQFARLSNKRKPEFQLEVHIWGAISRAGIGPMIIFEETMGEHFFQEEIVVKLLAPYIKQQWTLGHRLVQDHKKHTASEDFLMEKGINLVRTPPESPDFNPMKIVWAAMKHHIRVAGKIDDKEELVAMINDFWYDLGKETCSRFIDRLFNVLPVVIERNGLDSEL